MEPIKVTRRPQCTECPKSKSPTRVSPLARTKTRLGCRMPWNEPVRLIKMEQLAEV